MNDNKNKKQCRTHTYLTEAEESRLAGFILQDLGDSSTQYNRDRQPKPLPAPSGMCDLIF